MLIINVALNTCFHKFFTCSCMLLAKKDMSTCFVSCVMSFRFCMSDVGWWYLNYLLFNLFMHLLDLYSEVPFFGSCDSFAISIISQRIIDDTQIHNALVYHNA